MSETPGPHRPHRAMGFRDLVLFYIVTGISLRWIATAATVGRQRRGHLADRAGARSIFRWRFP